MSVLSILSIILTLALVVLLAKPTGHYIARALSYETTKLDAFFGPFEHAVYKLSGIKQTNQ